MTQTLSDSSALVSPAAALEAAAAPPAQNKMDVVFQTAGHVGSFHAPQQWSSRPARTAVEGEPHCRQGEAVAAGAAAKAAGHCGTKRVICGGGEEQ